MNRRHAAQEFEVPTYGSPHGRSLVALLVLVGIAYAAYFILRYDGMWIENDTSVFTGTTTAMLKAGSAFFAGQYSHGPGYPAWLGDVSLETGLSPMVVNGLLAPFFGVVFMVLTAHLLYRKFLRTEAAVAVAVLILFLVPDVMFTVLRGNHEKINVPFIMLAFYCVLWVVDAVRNQDFRSIALSTMLYYVSVFMNGVTNDYFGVFLIIATFIAALFLWLFRRPRWSGGAALPYAKRFAATTFISGLLMVWVMVFLFPQSGSDTSLFVTLIHKLQNLFTTQVISSNPYAIASQQWTSPLVNTMFSVFHYGLIGISAMSIVHLFVIVVVRKTVNIRGEEYVAVASYVALAILVAIAIPADLVGLNAGTNLELRNYTYYALFAPPIIVMMVGALRARLAHHRKAAWLRATVASMYAILFVVGMLKGTVEPLVSNVWMQYTRSEREALVVFQNHTTDTALWTGGGNRLAYLYNALFPDSSTGDQVVGYSIGPSPYATDIMTSPMIRASTIATQIAMPSVSGMDRVFDDGGAQIYRRPTTTPFQY